MSCILAAYCFLCAKKKMRGKVCLLLVWSLVSCGLVEIGGGKSDGDHIWIGPGSMISGGGSGALKNTVWYAVGIDYPDRYDWRADSDAGSVKCSLVVFANGIPMMKVPVGTEYETGADPDMHRVLDGDLYTDYSADSSTVIKKNGRNLFRFSGREMIVGMAVDGEDLYTLGQSRSGKGFSFRMNGDVVYEHRTGMLFGHFIRNGHDYSFAYAEPIHVSKDSLERYYVYTEGSVQQIAVRDDVRKVWDVFCNGDSLCYIASLVGVPDPVLVSEKDMAVLEVPPDNQIKACRFVPGTSGSMLEGLISTSDGMLTGCLWQASAMKSVFPAGYTIASLCVCDDAVSCVLTHHRTGDELISRGGELFQVPSGYSVMGTSPICMVDGILHVGLTSLDGSSPAVWKDGEISTLNINGYISSISVP